MMLPIIWKSLQKFVNKQSNTNDGETIDPFHKWLPIINSFVSIKISLINLVFE